jgi:hypothetical protein
MPIANAASLTPPTFSDNFSADLGMWKYSGSAYRDAVNGYVVLTTNLSTLEVGTIWFNYSFNSSFTASFRYKAGGGSGGDGFVMMFYKQEKSTLPGGGYLGFSSPSYDVEGYGVEFDNFQNSWDPSANHIALIQDNYRNHLISVNDLRTEDNQWHNVNVAVASSSVIVSVDSGEVFSWNGTLDRTYGGFGFAGGTASAKNWAIIDDFSIASALPAPTLSAATGGMGKIIKVTGPAGTVPANTAVQLYWDTTTGAWDGAKGLMNSTTADASGAYEAWFDIPEATNGAHYVLVKDAAGNTTSTAFTVQTKNKNIPESGLPGDTITGNFYGFHATKNLAAILSTVNPPVSTVITSEELTTPNGVAKAFTGTFAHRYLVPRTILFRTNGVEQAHDDGMGNIVDSGGQLTASGTIDYVTGEYDIIFTTAPPALPIGLGTDYSYWGTSSAPGSTQFDLGWGVTNSVGTAIITWKVPANVAISRTYNVLALESGFGLNRVDFRIMGIQLSSSSGPTGETITLTGNGFSPNEAWIATIGTDKILGNGTISADGLLQGGSGLLVPYGLSPGTYPIKVLDVDSDAESTVQFTVTYGTTITVTPDGAPNGFNVTISGKGFSYLATGPSDLSYTLYNMTSTGVPDHIWAMDVEQNWPAGGPYIAMVNGAGVVRAYWIVPGSTLIGTGKYYINATDADDYVGEASFNVLAPHVLMTPRNATFAVGDTILFQLENTYKTAPVDGSVIKIYDSSSSLVFSGDTLDAAKWIKTGLWYTLPDSAQTVSGNPMVIPDGAPLGIWSYKWVGTDDKNIVAGTFTVTRARVETAYLSLQSTVNNEITSANYSSPDAKALLDQAQVEYQQATTLANQGKFQDAITDLNSASDLLSRAQATESTYQAAYNSYQSLLQSFKTELNQATGAVYKSPDAQSLLSQAQTYYSQATNSANSGQLQDANSKLASASNLLDQAAAAEKSYVPPASGGIPGFPFASSVVGLLLCTTWLWLYSRRHPTLKRALL